MHINSKLSVTDVELAGLRVLMRVDYNVPIADGEVQDATRITSSIPTINLVFSKKARVLILMSHCGRPDGRRQEKYSLAPIVPTLERATGRKVIFVNDCVGAAVEQAIDSAADGSIVLLENLRYHLEEEGKGINEAGEKTKATPEAVDKFRAALSRLGDVYINDAFGTAHRAHSSMVGVNVPIKCAGLLMQKELEYFSKALDTPRKPFLSILGGAKVRDKIKLIMNLLDKVDEMIIGGGMAYTFLKVTRGISIGNSLWDEEGSHIVMDIMKAAEEKNVIIHLPTDFVISNQFGEDGIIKTVTVAQGIPDGFEGLDAGPETIAKSREVINRAKTIVWNGPQGVFEMPSFAKGSLAFVDAVIEATENGACSIVGGGDTASLVQNTGRGDKISHISTGGGASLELLEGKHLPGVVALSDRQ